MKVKCLWCGDIIENNEIHNMKFCKCGKTGLDFSPYCPRISFSRNEQDKKMYKVIDNE